MVEKYITVDLFRFDPSVDKQPLRQAYEVPVTEGMSVLDALDYIYENLDGSLAYYDHAACRQAICGHCTLNVNGKPTLICQAPLVGDIVVDLPPKREVVRDLVGTRRKG